MEKKAKYTTYIAGPIEHAKGKEVVSGRTQLNLELRKHPDLLVYCPVQQEAKKVGKTPIEHCKYVTGLKRAGRYDQFFYEMWKIWFGDIQENSDLMQVMSNLRMRKFIDGNKASEIDAWGDAEAVVRSDFIVVHWPIDNKSVGTSFEVLIAMIFRIPIYLIVPNATRTDSNSTLLWGVLGITQGEFFSSVNECVKFIVKTYNLKEHPYLKYEEIKGREKLEE